MQDKVLLDLVVIKIENTRLKSSRFIDFQDGIISSSSSSITTLL